MFHRAVDIEAHPPRSVAVKFLRPGAAEDHLLDLFMARELEALLALKHPNIVELIDAGIDAYRSGDTLRSNGSSKIYPNTWATTSAPGQLRGCRSDCHLLPLSLTHTTMTSFIEM